MRAIAIPYITGLYVCAYDSQSGRQGEQNSAKFRNSRIYLYVQLFTTCDGVQCYYSHTNAFKSVFLGRGYSKVSIGCV